MNDFSKVEKHTQQVDTGTSKQRDVYAQRLTLWGLVLSVVHPGRRRCGKQVTKLLQEQGHVLLSTVECPECRFYMPVPATASYTLCAWCGCFMFLRPQDVES